MGTSLSGDTGSRQMGSGGTGTGEAAAKKPDDQSGFFWADHWKRGLLWARRDPCWPSMIRTGEVETDHDINCFLAF